MPELRIARKNDFIFRKYKIMINKEIFYLKRGEKKNNEFAFRDI